VQVILSPDTDSHNIPTDFKGSFVFHSFPLPCLANMNNTFGQCSSYLHLSASGFSNHSSFSCQLIAQAIGSPVCQVTWSCPDRFAILPYGAVSMTASDLSALMTRIEWSIVTTGEQGDSTLNGNISAGFNQVFRGLPVPQLSIKTMGINYTIHGSNSEGTLVQFEGVVQGSELPIGHLSNDSGSGLMLIVNRDAFILDVEVIPQYSFFAAVAQLIAWALAVLSVGRSAVIALSKVCERKIYYSVIDLNRGRSGKVGDHQASSVQLETFGSERALNPPTQSNHEEVPRASGALLNGTVVGGGVAVGAGGTSSGSPSLTSAPAPTTPGEGEGEGGQVEVEVFREAGNTNDGDQEVRARQSEESKEFI